MKKWHFFSYKQKGYGYNDAGRPKIKWQEEFSSRRKRSESLGLLLEVGLQEEWHGDDIKIWW
jgi:hypothetical protein